jgi:hypothetical protein
VVWQQPKISTLVICFRPSIFGDPAVKGPVSYIERHGKRVTVDLASNQLRAGIGSSQIIFTGQA